MYGQVCMLMLVCATGIQSDFRGKQRFFHAALPLAANGEQAPLANAPSSL